MQTVHTPLFNEVTENNTTVYVPVHNDPVFEELVNKAAKLSEELRKTIHEITCYNFDLSIELKKKL